MAERVAPRRLRGVSIDLTLLNIYKKMGEAEGNDHAV